MFITEEQNNLKAMQLQGLLTPTEYYNKLNEILQNNIQTVTTLIGVNKEILAELNFLFGEEKKDIDVIDFEDPNFAEQFSQILGLDTDYNSQMN